LILAGTTEATELARELSAAGIAVVSSFAGATSQRVDRPGHVRVGGFGGVAGLGEYLAAEQIAAVVDATHPFAAVMPFHADAACRAQNVPLCRLLRAPWTPTEHDRWIEVVSIAAAAERVSELDARRVMLAIGRQTLDAFVPCTSQWFLVRSIERPTTQLPHMLSIQDRGPFTIEGEQALLREHSIDLVVAKNAGGHATAAKLRAARELGIRVVMVERPAQPSGVHTVASVDEAARWLRQIVTALNAQGSRDGPAG
jgi:precorrin-6A/cobalt-precorrin-6A reductase